LSQKISNSPSLRLFISAKYLSIQLKNDRSIRRINYIDSIAK